MKLVLLTLTKRVSAFCVSNIQTFTDPLMNAIKETTVKKSLLDIENQQPNIQKKSYLI